MYVRPSKALPLSAPEITYPKSFVTLINFREHMTYSIHTSKTGSQAIIHLAHFFSSQSFDQTTSVLPKYLTIKFSPLLIILSLNPLVNP